MSLETFRIGAATVQLPLNSSTNPSSMISVTLSASAVTPLVDNFNNDVNADLDTSATYQFMVGIVGRDTTNGGLTVGPCSHGSGIVSVTAGQAVSLYIANADLPSNFQYGMAMAVFMKKNSGSWKLTDFGYIDHDGALDFNHLVIAEPLTTAPAFSAATLRSSTSDSTLGDRTPKGITFETISPTTGGVTVQRNVQQVTVSPDNSTDYQIVTARSTTITFAALPNDLRQVIQGNAGLYGKFTTQAGSHTVEVGQMSLQTAVASLLGNKPVKLVLPPDGNKVQEIRMYLGSISQNQTGGAEAWTRSNTTPINFVFSTISADKILKDQHVELAFKYKA